MFSRGAGTKDITGSKLKGDSRMPKFSSKQEKIQGFGNPMSVLLSITLIGASVMLWPLNVRFHNATEDGILWTFTSTDDLHKSARASFAADEQYWNSKCNNGWASDSKCDAIVLRVQSCAVNVLSPYCSTHESYIQEFLKQ